MLDAVGGPGPGLQPALRDRSPADLAVPVAAASNPCQCRLDLGQHSGALLQQGRGLGKLEGDGGTFRIVFVVDVGVLPGGIHGGDVLTERRKQGKLSLAFLFEEDPEPFDVNHSLQG